MSMRRRMPPEYFLTWRSAASASPNAASSSAARSRAAGKYSGGMRRRLDLAASLVGAPRLLYLDEPTTGLDPRSRMALWDVIRERVRSGATVLLTTQYLDEADQLADRIQVIDRGRTVALGTPDELKSSIGGSSLQVQLVERDDLDRAATLVLRLLDEQAVPSPEARRLTVALPRSDRAVDVLLAMREAGIAIESIAVAKPSLDEVFLALTGHDTRDDENTDETQENLR